MMGNLGWALRALVVLLAAALIGGMSYALAPRSATDSATPPPAGPLDSGGIDLVAYDSCAAALKEFRRAALTKVGPYGMPEHWPNMREGRGRLLAVDAVGAADQSMAGTSRVAPNASEHSGTNVHEAGVDEPDLAKTDGRRLVTLTGERLRVIDVASKRVIASVKIPGGMHPEQLLLHGDRVLVFGGGGRFGPAFDTALTGPNQFGSKLVLVDIGDGARIIGALNVDGGYLDARMTGSVARIVVSSTPPLDFVHPAPNRTPSQARIANRNIVKRSSISDWLPRYSLVWNGKRTSGPLVDCSAISHPERDRGTSMLTVLTVDLERDLGKGDPISIVADGSTVYGTATSLYVADPTFGDEVPLRRGNVEGGIAKPVRPRTNIYQFDTSGPGRPTHVASGTVEGTLLNQYSMSEHQGDLRIATTEGQQWGWDRRVPERKSESAITVLARHGDRLERIGRVDGLGVDEQIYAVRFLGDVGYVVTFRQVDPLYAVDLSDPRRPRVTGELKITGYSAYLHPAGEQRLIGVGQEATKRGRTTGLQVSLFDTSDPAAPGRLDQHHVPDARSEVEHDPHAFLYWPDKRLIALPMWWWGRGTDRPGTLVLRIDGDELHEVGVVSHPRGKHEYSWEGARRTLVIGDELWTLSGAGVQVNGLDGLVRLAWVPFG